MRKKVYAVIGLGTFGSSIARILSEKGQQVIAIDKDEQRVQEIADSVTKAVVADATDDKALKTLDISDIDYAIVSIGDNMESSILITLMLKEMGVKFVIAKGLNEMHGRVLSRIGADRIVFPEIEMAEKLALSLLSPNILEEIYLSSDFNMIELVAPANFVGKNLKDIDVRAKYGVTLIGKKTRLPTLTDEGETDWEEQLTITPNPEDEIHVAGADSAVNEIRRA